MSGQWWLWWGVGFIVVLIMQAAFMAYYADAKGYDFIPIFISALFIGFPLVLLAVTIMGKREIKVEGING
jgi:hypothetical protein